jgi:tetratricopeptide (TPR) repeat protein
MATAAMKMKAPQPSSIGLFQSPEQRRVVLALLLALLTLFLYNPVANHGFVNFDDPGYVTGNRHIQAGLSWSTLRWAFASTDQANWHPLTWLSHALDYQLFHLKAAGHHYDNLLLHAACVILLFLFLESVTGLAARSAVVAGLFAVHPINVESVAWISERKNVLCTVFFLLGLYTYAWYASRPGGKRYLAVIALFALGLMSKPMVITFPLVLLLLDYWPLQRMNFVRAVGDDTQSRYAMRPLKDLILEKVPMLALSAASAVLTMVAQKGGGAVRDQYSFSLRAANAIVAYARYIGKAVWPSDLAAIYPFPRAGLPVWEVLLSTGVLVSLTVAVLTRARKSYLTVGWFWFLGTLVPVIGLVQVGEQAMADRYAYIPFIGLFVAAVWGIADWAASRKISATYLMIGALLAIGSFAAVAHVQMQYWQNSLVLWTHTLQVTDRNFVAEDNLGAELINMGKIEEARAHFQTATEINPQDGFSQINLGVCEKRMGNTKAAVEHYKEALRISSAPTLRATAHNNLASVYRLEKNYPAAQQNYTAALKINPGNPMTLIGLGLIAQKKEDLEGATEYYSRAAAASPSDIADLLLAQALQKSGRAADSAAAFEQAKRTSPNLDFAQEEVKRLLAE